MRCDARRGELPADADPTRSERLRSGADEELHASYLKALCAVLQARNTTGRRWTCGRSASSSTRSSAARSRSTGRISRSGAVSTPFPQPPQPPACIRLRLRYVYVSYTVHSYSAYTVTSYGCTHTVHMDAPVLARLQLSRLCSNANSNRKRQRQRITDCSRDMLIV